MQDTKALDGGLAARDFILASAAGLLSFAAFYWLSIPGLDPSQWSEVAVAARLRPPQAMLPGLWRVLTCGFFSAVGIPFAVKALSLLGAAVGGICVALVYLVVRQSFLFLARLDEKHAVWTNFISPFFAMVAALFVAVADPIWRISQTFSPEQLHLLLLLLAIYAWLRWITLGSNWRLYSLVALLGVASAETPFAIILTPLLLAGYCRFQRCVENGMAFNHKLVYALGPLPRWRMFFIFIGSLGLAIRMNVKIFAALGGVAANGWRMGDLYFRYGIDYWHVLTGSSNLAGWALGLGFGLFPLVVTMMLLPRSIRDTRPLAFHRGVLLFFVCALAVMQCGAFPAARFWTLATETASVSSGFFLSFYVVCSAVTIAMVGATFAFECQRVYLSVDEPRPGLALRGLVPAVAVALFALAAAHASRTVEAEMQRIVRDALEETVRECGDAKWIFTDGRLDDGLSLVAAESGRKIVPLNMMSGATRWEQSLRERHFPEGSADRDNASIGIPALLRVWAGEKPGGMDEAAVQLGFEFWKREHKSPPKASGFVARTSGMSDEEAARGIEAAKALSARIFELEGKKERAHPSPALADALSFVSWRLSRLARFRNDDDTADRLDRGNAALKRTLSVVDHERQRTFMRLTPLEGLRLALGRTDFVEARRHASAVLKSDEDHPEANFGMGMSYLVEGRLNDAELYLRRCLKKCPNEPAVLNNLSIICRKTNRYEEAEELARKALKVFPDSPEVKQTLQDAINRAK